MDRISLAGYWTLCDIWSMQNRDREDERVILIRGDLDAVAVAHAEPVLDTCATWSPRRLIEYSWSTMFPFASMSSPSATSIREAIA
jgi:hypothetical protein